MVRFIRFLIASLICFIFTTVVVSVQENTFPAGSKIAYIDIQRVVGESNEGQAANSRVEELSDQKLSEIDAKTRELQGEVDSLNQELQEHQQRLQQGQNVMSIEARTNLQRDVTRLQVTIQRANQDSQAEIERFTQDAEAEVQELQQRLQIEFQTRLAPLIQQVAAERQLGFIFNATDIVWADLALDITQELIDRLNNNSGNVAP